jgi:2-polyprenyl-3-methyl-5-hydroxy-6-metoxy-1,4-benzoquinol methylase
MSGTVSDAVGAPFWERHSVAAAVTNAEQAGATQARCLDVGCGNGYVLSRYPRHSAEVHGIDVARTTLNLSRRRFFLDNV